MKLKQLILGSAAVVAGAWALASRRQCKQGQPLRRNSGSV